MRAFRTARAGYVLVALRPVGNQGASAFMQCFHHHWLAQERSDPADALRAARLEALAEPGSHDPTWAYFTIVGVQVGSRGGTGLVRLWFQTNGKDADNSNCEQEVPTPTYTTVMISQGVGEYKKGDKVNAMISGSATGIGLVYKKPAGEPAVPSVIFSAWKLD